MKKPKTKQTLNGNFQVLKRLSLLTMSFAIFLVIYTLNPLKAQILSPSVVASSGSSNIGVNCILNWTLGQIADETYSKTSVILTQGFQQNFKSLPIQTEVVQDDGNFLLFPNPAINHVTITFPKRNKEAYKLELFNSKGLSVLIKTLSPGQETENIDLTGLPANFYWLIITNKSGINLKTFKFVKL